GELRIRADRSEHDELRDTGHAALLEDERAHHHVRVPVPPGIRAIRADPTDLGREVDHELGPRRLEELRDVVRPRQVVVTPPRDERLAPAPAHTLDEMRPEDPSAPGYQRAHPPRVASGS